MRTIKSIIVAAAFLPFLASALAQTQVPDVEKITQEWKCKFCPFEGEQGFHGEVEAGAGYVSDDSFKFGEYTGLTEKGGYFVGNAYLRYRGEEAKYWNIEADNIGLESRYLNVEGGKQGKYKLSLEYNEIPHFIDDTSQTPFLGVGGTVLTLPPSWVPAPSTSGFTDLANSLRPVDIETKRKKLGVGASVIPRKHWAFTTKYTRETKEGLESIGGAIGANFATAKATILPNPVDYITHQVDLITSYATSRHQTKFGYYGSFFENDNRFLTWQNPFVDPSDPTNSGSLSQPPENEFHQLYFSGGYQVSPKNRITTHFAIGRMLQDDQFLPYTVNPSLQPPSPTGPLFPLPRSSADARVNTYAANVALLSSINDKLRLTGRYTYEELENETPRAAYDYVIADTAVVSSANAPSNLPYSFKKQTLELSGNYLLLKRATLLAGLDYENYERTFQAVADSDEYAIWAKLTLQPSDKVDLALKLSRADRNGDSYELVPQTSPPQNPLMRKFNMADRERDQGDLYATFLVTEKLTIGFSTDYAKDDYNDTKVGLIKSKDVGYTLDLTLVPREDISIYGFYTRETIESKQRGASAFIAPAGNPEPKIGRAHV